MCSASAALSFSGRRAILIHRYKLFNLARGYNKNLTPTDVSGMASCVLLSALAIPPYDKASGAMTDAQTELEHERSVRMAAILGFSVVRVTVHQPRHWAGFLRQDAHACWMLHWRRNSHAA